jgi:hypothetical protein
VVVLDRPRFLGKTLPGFKKLSHGLQNKRDRCRVFEADIRPKVNYVDYKTLTGTSAVRGRSSNGSRSRSGLRASAAILIA